MLNTSAPGSPGSPYHDASIEDVEARIENALDTGGDARTWLDRALAAARDPEGAAWELHFASAGRHAGRTAAADARVLLLHAARADAGTLGRLYRQGTAAERAAVLRALHLLPAGSTPDAVPLVEDALRANDTTLVAAAVGPYAAARLGPHPWRHAVLKCLFTGVPLDAVAGLAQRAHGDAELARMLRDFAAERTAAGRPVPADLRRALGLTGHAGPPAEPPSPETAPSAPRPAASPAAPSAASPAASRPAAPRATAPETPAPPPEEF
ncbi:EboA domain-containing protein [Streptomyces sp. HNM0575]|uniref:EboA domain-containing protein n=1 Tax=Streptomyces sp. HNM0575 TaxID=2716338 RepID=UPI00145D59E0|nr:EboA domain-containing protein [Streptomyces sp. HNM0575]